MDNFKYHSPTAVYFGQGQVDSLPQEIKGRYKKILLVTGGGSVKRNGVFDSVVSGIKKAGAKYIELSGVMPNPRIKSVYQGIGICKSEGIDLVL